MLLPVLWRSNRTDQKHGSRKALCLGRACVRRARGLAFPHALQGGFLDLKYLKFYGFGTLRPHFRATLDVTVISLGIVFYFYDYITIRNQ